MFNLPCRAPCRVFFFSALLFMVAALAACDTGDPGEAPRRGSLVRADSLSRASLDDLRSDNPQAPEAHL